MKFTSILLSVILVAFMSTGCKSSKTMKGGAIGAGAGGAAGAAIGSQSDNTAKGAILGAIIGGTAGALIGNYMDKQAEELESELEGAEVERVGEGIRVVFDSGILFDFDSDNLRPASKENLRELAETLQEYDETEVLIEGHTDNIGPNRYNKKLSVDRAESVEDYLTALGVQQSRLIVKGYGEKQPIASNATEEGRQQNRRVEVAIWADEELKEAAKEGEIEDL
jgi:outer membrane protein OmpA-like peptidoglycan-associated protein